MVIFVGQISLYRQNSNKATEKPYSPRALPLFTYEAVQFLRGITSALALSSNRLAGGFQELLLITNRGGFLFPSVLVISSDCKVVTLTPSKYHFVAVDFSIFKEPLKDFSLGSTLLPKRVHV